MAKKGKRKSEKRVMELKVVPPSKGAKVFFISAHNVIAISSPQTEYVYE
jgi:hypothetical protein